QRVFTRPLRGSAQCRSPGAVPESRNQPARISPLVKPCSEDSCRDGFGAPAKIAPRIFNGSSRPPERLLAGFEVAGQSHWRKTGNRNCPAGHIAAALCGFKPDAVSDGVTLCFMDLHQNVGLVLVGNRTA